MHDSIILENEIKSSYDEDYATTATLLHRTVKQCHKELEELSKVLEKDPDSYRASIACATESSKKSFFVMTNEEEKTFQSRWALEKEKMERLRLMWISEEAKKQSKRRFSAAPSNPNKFRQKLQRNKSSKAPE